MTGEVTAFIIALDEDNLVSSVKNYMEGVQGRLATMHETEEDPVRLIQYRSAAIDKLIASLYKLAQKVYAREGGKDSFQISVLSQGGYGRRELCLHSDIDILLLYEGKAQTFIKLLNERVLQPLWDSGLEVGFAVRTVKDCRQLMEQDLTILTSLLDARFIVGDEEVANELQKMLEKYFSSAKNREKFLQRKIAENKERQEKYGGSIYLLEPNLKEGEGGLRDYHTIYWLARVYDRIRDPQELVTRGYLTEEEFRTLWEALRFLWRLRNELHLRTKRRTDQLAVEYQEPIARVFGYENTAQFLGVELFMQKYYTYAADVHVVSEKAIRRINRKEPELFPPPKIPLKDPHCRVVDGRITPATPDLLDREPIYFLKLFELSRRLQVEIDDVAKERLEKAALSMPDEFRTNSEATAFFREMLTEPIGLGKMLGEMNDLGVLGAFLPEFGKLRFRVQHNLYHVYTVDVHSLFAVGKLGKLAQGDYAERHPTLTQILADVTVPERRALLSFAVLYHDIGKGEGKGHVERGAPIIHESAKRLGFSAADQDALEFLERSHLIMTHVAFRRDLEEQNLIIQFARTMPNLELLNMLYILTFCDVKAANPDAMTDWKASLLEYLYVKTRDVIQTGSFTKERATTLVAKVLEETLTQFSADEDKKKCREFFSMMAPRYLLATPPSTIVRHIKLWERFEGDPIVFEWRVLEKEGLNEVTLLTWESVGLFSRMTGLFAAHTINIIEAQLNLTNRGHGLQTFKVADHEGKPINDPEKWGRVEKDLRDVLERRVPIETLVAEKFRPSLFKKKVAQVLPSRVDIDNDVSAYYTVIDVYTQDRVGLLYQITSILSALGLYVDVSKISTKIDQVADTFYVRDIFGHKITSEGRLKKIHDVLLQVLEEEPTPGWHPPRF